MASTYPVTADSFSALSKVDVENPDSIDAITALQASVVAVETAELSKHLTHAGPYAATVAAIDASAGDFVIVGQLTGNIAITAITNPAKGQELTFLFQQDGTGSRTVTWPANVKAASTAVSATASKYSTVKLKYDGTNWWQIAGVPAVA